jgi:hypothetical protein
MAEGICRQCPARIEIGRTFCPSCLVRHNGYTAAARSKARREARAAWMRLDALSEMWECNGEQWRGMPMPDHLPLEG